MAENFDAEMATHAQAAVAMVQESFGHALDFSEQSVGAVESVLGALANESDLTEDFVRNTAVLFGSYLGEVARRACRRGHWIEGAFTPDAPPPMLVIGEITISPFVWCFKRIYNGQADSVVTKYLAFRQAAAERGELASLDASAQTRTAK